MKEKAPTLRKTEMDRENIQDAKNLFIVDNSDDQWKVQLYLKEWADIISQLDIATGFFDIGALLSLDGEWQKVGKIRILMGDELSGRTKKAMLDGISKKVSDALNNSIETEKEKNDFLQGVPAIVDAIKNGQIVCKVFTKEKFHAKAYITYAKKAVIGPQALVGSSNFTLAGIKKNVELNIKITSGQEVKDLQEWYEKHWEQAEDITSEVLRVIERHTAAYSPFEVYAKSLQEYFRGIEMSPEEWEERESKMFPVLDKYQQDGYRQLLKVANKWNGAFLCDGVGLGKTYIGLMLVERFVRENMNVALFVTKGARESVWESALKKYLPNLGRVFSHFTIFNHTDLGRVGEWEKNFKSVKEKADVIIIDEGHHFRNPGIAGKGERRQSRYRILADIAEGKKVFLLTATPINNRLIDLQHMIELFTKKQPNYFSSIGIHSLPGHFRKMENDLEKEIGWSQHYELFTDQIEAQKVLYNDNLFKELVVQRSRAYVIESQLQKDGALIFPKREPPIVVPYSAKKTYEKLLNMVEEAFKKDKPLFALALYNPLSYLKEEAKTEDKMEAGRQAQVVALIRTLFLKRFESSAHAFRLSCETLFIKLLTWLEKHSQTPSEKKFLERWKNQHREIIDYVHKSQHEITGQDEELDEDIIDEELLGEIEELSRDKFKVEEMLNETQLDLNELVEFLKELKKFTPKNDDKLQQLTKLLKKDPWLSKYKVLIFSEFMDTAKYLRRNLESDGIKDLDEVDSSYSGKRVDAIKNFAPYYNGSSSSKVGKETRVLISTDILAEGLNLQDATFVINYDLHWNPVRLMQRIGRVDRRMDPQVEAQLIADHPELKETRGVIKIWNFLPPDELDELLKLYSRVANKTLKISKTFGIEGKKLLKPDDDYEALRNFNHKYSGEKSDNEKLRLEYSRLLKEYPDLVQRLNNIPDKVFTGKEHPKPGTKAIFFCYALPIPSLKSDTQAEPKVPDWSGNETITQWYLYDLAGDKISENALDIFNAIKSEPQTPTHHSLPQQTLSEIRQKIEKRIKDTYLKQIQAPIGIKPKLKAWMELS